MVDYSKGKIYKLTVYDSDKIYIGSTTQNLCNRLAKHKNCFLRYKEGKYHYVSSFELFEIGNVKIELIETFPCSSKEELFAQEAKYIKTLECVNKVIPGRTISQWREDNKESIKEKKKKYAEDNKELLKEKKKKYVEENKELIKERDKKKYEKNKEAIKERGNEENKEVINEKRKKEKVICDKCQKEMRKDSLSRHVRTVHKC